MGAFSVVVIFALIIVLIVVLLRQASISTRKKFAVGGALILCVAIMGAYNYRQSLHTNINTLLEEAFDAGQTLNCEGFLVHQNDFNLISQTHTLIGKSGTPTSNIIVLLEKCQITQPSKQDEELVGGHTIEELGRD